MISKLRYILYIIIFAIAIYFYIYNKKIGSLTVAVASGVHVILVSVRPLSWQVSGPP